MKNNFFHRQVTNAGYTFNNSSERYCIRDDESLGKADFLLSNSFSENQLKKKKKKGPCKKLSLISKKRPFYNMNYADGPEESKLMRVGFNTILYFCKLLNILFQNSPMTI